MEANRSLRQLSQLLDDSRQVGDQLADDVIENHGADSGFAELLKRLKTNDQLREAEDFPFFRELIRDMTRRLGSFDRQRIEEGQAVFRKYSSDILPILGLYSLPYCYAAEEGARVLVMSRYLNEDPSKRLKETGEFVLDVGALGSFRKDGNALAAIAKVRLIHSYIRKHLKPNMTHEVPVNQEDMVGTNLSFSLIVLRGLRKLGVKLGATEERAYMYLWWSVGQLLGIQGQLLPDDLKSAALIESSIRKRQFRANEAGRQLTQSLLRHFENLWTFRPLSPAELMAFMVGDPISQYLGLPKPSALTTGAVQIASVQNFFRKYSEDNYSRIYQLAEFEAFSTTPTDLKI